MYSEKLLYRNKKSDTGLCHGELSAGELYAAKSVFGFYDRKKSRLILNQRYYFKQEGKANSSQWKNSLWLKLYLHETTDWYLDIIGYWWLLQSTMNCKALKKVYQLLSGCECQMDMNFLIFILHMLNYFYNKKAVIFMIRIYTTVFKTIAYFSKYWPKSASLIGYKFNIPMFFMAYYQDIMMQ